MKKTKPTSAELDILAILWEKQEASVKEVHQLLSNQKAVGYTTVLKFMQILFEKGFVKRDESQKAHLYSPIISKNSVRENLLNEILTKVFDNSVSQLIDFLLINQKSSPEEMKKIRKSIKLLQKEAKGKNKSKKKNKDEAGK